MAKNNLQELVENLHKASLKGNRIISDLMEAKSNIEKQAALRSIKWALLLMGPGFGLLSITFKNSWVADSPLFNVAGAVACFLFIVFCWMTGVLWWILTGSKAVCIWSNNLWPFCTQPYRSGAGIVAVFVVIALFCPLLLIGCSRLPGIRKNWMVCLIWLRRLLWLLTLAVWLIAIWLNTADFWNTTLVSAVTDEHGRKIFMKEIHPVQTALFSKVRFQGSTGDPKLI